MRADSLGGRIVGAIARDPAVDSPVSAPAELRIWTDAELTVRPRLRPGLPRSSMLGRIVAALARTEAVASTTPFTPAPPEAPTEDANLRIFVAGKRQFRRTARLTRASGPAHSYEPVEPTSAARLGITTVPA
jgi:hypothetical protein